MGAGSWGTTFAQVLCDAGTSTVLHSRRPAQAKALGELHENPDYLPGITLSAELEATADAAAALDGADIVAFAVPAQTLRANLLEWAPAIPADALLVSLIKGIEHGTRQRMSEVICEVLGADPARVAVVAGPNLAGEIVRRQRFLEPHHIVCCQHLRRAKRPFVAMRPKGFAATGVHH